MYGPDAYLFETNMVLLANLSDEELSDPTLIAQLTPGTTALNELGAWLSGALERGLNAVADWFAPAHESPERAGYWMFPPLY